VTPSQCRAARFLLGWNAEDLANKVGVSPTTVRNFELGRVRKTQKLAVESIARTLRDAGVKFHDGEGEGDTVPFAAPTHVVLEDGSSVTLECSSG